MPEFKITEGRFSAKYNHFKEYSLQAAMATTTRLMGVVAMHLIWGNKENDHLKLYQTIHLDFSEYGVDDYREFIMLSDAVDIVSCFSEEQYSGKDYTDLSSYTGFPIENRPLRLQRAAKAEWEHISGSLGGEVIHIGTAAAASLIKAALGIGIENIDKRPRDIKNFFSVVNCRMNMMLNELSIDCVVSEEQYIGAVSPRSLTEYETINYFLIRIFDRDFPAAEYLSEMNRNEFEQIIQQSDISTLMHNKISLLASNAHSSEYICAAVVMSEETGLYTYIKLKVTICKKKEQRKYAVKNLNIIFSQTLSEFEVAMQLSGVEYITVYDFDDDAIETLNYRSMITAGTIMSPVPNGLMYTKYNSDNAHVNSANYSISRDVYGSWLITPNNQLVMMSSEIIKINAMELDIQSGLGSDALKLEGRYKFKTQIFQTFTEMSGMRFEDLLE